MANDPDANSAPTASATVPNQRPGRGLGLFHAWSMVGGLVRFSVRDIENRIRGSRLKATAS